MNDKRPTTREMLSHIASGYVSVLITKAYYNGKGTLPKNLWGEILTEQAKILEETFDWIAKRENTPYKDLEALMLQQEERLEALFEKFNKDLAQEEEGQTHGG